MKRYSPKTEDPGIATVLNVLGFVSIAAGVLLFFTAISNYALVMAGAWLASGFISAAMFFAMAAGLTYLDHTRDCVRYIASKLDSMEDQREIYRKLERKDYKQ